MEEKLTRRKRLKSLTCPSCNETGRFRKILYGMPGDDFDFEKYAVGGCIIEENAPDIECAACRERFVWGEINLLT